MVWPLVRPESRAPQALHPPLTNDRSAAALASLFAGKSGALGGVSVSADGSNINPVALALLNLKLPDGQFLIPTPQKINPSAPFASQGLSVFSEPCQFDEEQFSVNADYLISSKSKLAGRFFFANNSETVTFPGNGLNPTGNIPGFRSPFSSTYRVFSLAHTYTFNNTRLNQAQFGYIRTTGNTTATTPFTWSSVGVSATQMNNMNELPSLVFNSSLPTRSQKPWTPMEPTSTPSPPETSLLWETKTCRKTAGGAPTQTARIGLFSAGLGRFPYPPTDWKVSSSGDGRSELAGDVQALSHELHPSILDNLGLVTAVKSFCREVSEQNGVAVEFAEKNIPSSLPREVSLSLFRVIQEALHNALKYSGQKHFKVHLNGNPDQIELEVSDQGAGFDLESMKNGRGLGLVSMTERIHMLNGRIAIDSKPNVGTAIRASVPLAAQTKAFAASAN